MRSSDITNTDSSICWAVLRFVAGAILLVFGLMHVSGMMPMWPLIQAAGLPAPHLTAIAASIAEVLAGISLLLGAYARVGAALAIGVMLGAVLTHLRIPNDAWPDVEQIAENPTATTNEPLFLMYVAIAIIFIGGIIIWKGAGRWSLDRRQSHHGSPQEAAAAADRASA